MIASTSTVIFIIMMILSISSAAGNNIGGGRHLRGNNNEKVDITPEATIERILSSVYSTLAYTYGPVDEPVVYYDHLVAGSEWEEDLSKDTCPSILPTKSGNKNDMKCDLQASQKCCYNISGGQAIICQCTGNFFWNEGLTFECRQGSASEC